MKFPTSLSTIFAFGIIAAVLAVIATILPNEKETPPAENYVPEINFQDTLIDELVSPFFPEKNSVEDKEASGFDISIPKLDPQDITAELEQLPIEFTTPDETNENEAEEIVVDPELVMRVENPRIESSELDLVPSSPDLLVETIADESVAAAEKAAKDETLRTNAIAENNLAGCAEISSTRVVAECRGAIYFGEAVAEKDIAKCDLITIEELKLRCQNYVTLML